MKFNTDKITRTCKNCKQVNVSTVDTIPVVNISITQEGKLKIDTSKTELVCGKCGENLIAKEQKMANKVIEKITKLLPTIWD